MDDLGYYRLEKYSLPHGYDIQIRWPDEMGEEELDDFLIWLDLVKTKIPRICRQNKKSAETQDA